MKYMAFVGTDGPQPEAAMAAMNRGFPAYLAEMERRGVRSAGRELELPETAVTVRRRDGETLVVDGPFAETKEFIGGLDLLDCSDLDEAIEVESESPVAQFLPFEVRPLGDEPRLTSGLAAFGRGDDSDGTPYLLMVWVDEAPQHDPALTRECDAWRAQLQSDFVMGGEIGGPETARTLRFRDGELVVSIGPFLDIEAFVAGIEIIRCADRAQAIDRASTHPLAAHDAIEVRPFCSA